MTEHSPSWITLAHILRPQGRKGEVLAELLTDFPERFEERERLYLGPPGFDGAIAAARQVKVVAHWLPMGKNAGRIVLQFEGVESISEAESLAGMDVLIPGGERTALEDDAVYISELIGCTVYDGVAAVGVVEDVRFAMTPDGARRVEETAPLLMISSAEGEVLVPFVKAFLINVDTRAKRIDMALPEGLVEVNRPDAKKD